MVKLAMNSHVSLCRRLQSMGSVSISKEALCWEGPFQGIDGPDERAMDRQVVKEEEGEGLNGSCENCEASSMTGQ